MTLHLVQWIIAASVALGLTLAFRRLLGQRGRQDSLLVAGSVVSAGFVLGGIVGLLIAEKGALGYLCFGVLGGVAMAGRWRANRTADSSSRGA